VAKIPSIKPDWKKITSYSIDLSGREVSYQLPEKISIDFPQQVGMNSNVYDLDLLNIKTTSLGRGAGSRLRPLEPRGLLMLLI